ncbi:restriction endonuclease [Algiphilus sp.]|uniref:restriction endonuclease n=1 Tax=Algiphilus sp. TaxID=1872431 RepID=UPI0032ED1A0E
MAIPDFQTLMRPVLEYVGGAEHRKVPDIYAAMVAQFELTPDEQEQLLPSGRVTVMRNRVAWSLAHMKMAKLLDSPARATYRITERGKQLLATGPDRISMRELVQYEEYREKRDQRKDESQTDVTAASDASTGDIEGSEQTPDEALEAAWKQIRAELESELLDHVMQMSPARFERLVVEVLVAMSYGGKHANAARTLGQSGDGGIDGVIDEDPLGLDTIYLQAKRWEGVVGRPEIQKFAGALQGRRAKKGVFITTSTFSREAIEYASLIENRIVLINGQRLAQLMADHDVGVSIKYSYPVKQVDSDFFAEDG